MRTKQWLNDYRDVAGTHPTKLTAFTQGCFEALQKLLNHLLPGSCEPVTGLNDVGTVRLLHRFLNKNAAAAGLGQNGLPHRLNMGTNKMEQLPPAFTSSQASVKALQNFLNSLHSV